MGGENQAEADRGADELLAAVGRGRDDATVAFFDDPTHERELWEVRESALGATAHVPGEDLTWPGWEDSAVGPDRLGDYLRDLRSLFDEYGYTQASLYGHFGQGCVHCRIPFDLFTAAGITQFRSFLERAADLVASYGGSLSGEHGDGQARGELLVRMFGPEIVRAFERMKAIFDPDDRMNPGKVVKPVRARREPPHRDRLSTTTSRAPTSRIRPTEEASPRPCSAVSGSANVGVKAAASCARPTW